MRRHLNVQTVLEKPSYNIDYSKVGSCTIASLVDLTKHNINNQCILNPRDYYFRDRNKAGINLV